MTAPTAPTHGKFCWYELRTKDPESAQAFYAKLFGWTLHTGDPSYVEFGLGETRLGGIAPTHGPGMPTCWVSYVQVDDVDETIAKAERAGGNVVLPAMDMPDVGRFAVVRDPLGAHIALYKGRHVAQDSSAPPPPGSFCWNENMTTDPERAVAFYGEIFGWRSEKMDMGPMGFYWTLWRGPVGEGGVVKTPPNVPAPPFWMPYVMVADVDATAQKARSLGGGIHHPPSDIPGIGRFAVLADPTGGAIAVYKSLR